MQFLERLQNWLSSRRANNLVSRSVSCDEHGVTQRDWLGDREVQEQLRWDQVDCAFGYKQDCFAFARILVALCDGSGNVRVHVSEEDAGYEVLIRELPKHVAGFPQPDDWFSRGICRKPPAQPI